MKKQIGDLEYDCCLLSQGNWIKHVLVESSAIFSLLLDIVFCMCRFHIYSIGLLSMVINQITKQGWKPDLSAHAA